MLRKKEQMSMSIIEILFPSHNYRVMPGLIYGGRCGVKYEDIFFATPYGEEVTIDKFETFAYAADIEDKGKRVYKPGVYRDLYILKPDSPITFANAEYFDDFVSRYSEVGIEMQEITVPLYKDDNGKWFYLPCGNEDENAAEEEYNDEESNNN